MPKYTSIEDIENYLVITIDDDFKEEVEEWIDYIDAWIDKITGRNFVADDAASDRYFDGNGKQDLLIDEAVEISKVEAGASIDSLTELTVEDDYFKFPYNQLPIRKLVRRGYVWYNGIKNVKIEGKWGYSVAAPKVIKFAAMIFTCGIINYSLNADGEVSSLTIGRYTVTYKDEKQWQDFDRSEKALKLYKRMTF